MNEVNTEHSGVKESDVTKNKIKAIIAYTARVVALTTASGPLMQTFLSALGFESGLIYLHSSILQATSFIGILLFSGFASDGSPIKRAAFSLIPAGILFFAYLPIAVVRDATPITYVLLIAVGTVQQLSVCLFTVNDYKMPYYVYRPEEYGVVLSVCGIVSSLFSLGTGALISAMTLKYDFVTVMNVAFGISAVLIGVASVMTLLQKSLIGESEYKENKSEVKSVSLIALLKNPVFTALIPANFLRGFSTGIIGVLATVALSLGYTESLTAAMVSAQSVSSLIACGLFAALAKKVSPSKMLMSGSIAAALLPVRLVSGEAVYISFFTAITLGKTLIDYSVPALLIGIVPKDIARPYHALRMVLQNAGAFIAVTVAAVMPVGALLILTSLLQLVSGVSFCAVNRKIRSSKREMEKNI